jgi:hypothetical protein
MFNPAPRIERVAIAPGHHALVIDDALREPERWVELAAQHRGEFETSPHNAYPGPELRLPEPLSARLDQFFAQYARAALGARRTLRMYSRLALATRRVAELEPRQWICHRDRLDTDPAHCVLASVLYLFRDPALGGTAFFAPRRGEAETALLIHESGTLAPEAFGAKYGVPRGYQTATSPWFEKTAAIEPRWNRLIFYDGGAVFHGSDIAAPERLDPDPRHGRLTWNGFFVCRRALSPSAGE